MHTEFMYKDFFNGKAAVLSVYPATGKSFFTRKYEFNNIKILDSDSSKYSWLYDDNNKKTTERNPEFPTNYIQYIKDNLDTADIIFVSSHKSVRDALVEAGIPFVIVYPDIPMEDVWVERMKQRQNSEEFIKDQEDNWEARIREIKNFQPDNPLVKKHILMAGENIGACRDFENFMIKEICKDKMNRFYEVSTDPNKRI